MARRFDLGSTLGGTIALTAIAPVISDQFKENLFLVLVIVFGGLGSLFFLAKGIQIVVVWIRRYRPCAHAVRRGKDGGCQQCIVEAERQADSQRKLRIKNEAATLRKEELRTLTVRWMRNAELYRHLTSQRFEDSVGVLFRQLGYEVKQTPYSNDRGKDAIAWKDGKKYIIECKHYGADKLIGRRDLQIFVAAMKEENAEAGFYINTGRFAKTAVEYAAQNRIYLYDGKRFPALVNTAFPVKVDISTARVMCLECGQVLTLAVAEASTSAVCDKGHTVTNDIIVERFLTTPLTPFTLMSGPPHLPYVVCDRCHSKMGLVKRPRGKLWVCSQYPKCKRAKRYEHD
jgi:hypothetical protein